MLPGLVPTFSSGRDWARFEVVHVARDVVVDSRRKRSGSYVGRPDCVLFNINHWSYNDNGLGNIRVYGHGWGHKCRGRMVGPHNHDGFHFRSGINVGLDHDDGFDRWGSFH